MSCSRKHQPQHIPQDRHAYAAQDDAHTQDKDEGKGSFCGHAAIAFRSIDVSLRFWLALADALAAAVTAALAATTTAAPRENPDAAHPDAANAADAAAANANAAHAAHATTKQHQIMADLVRTTFREPLS